MPVAIDGVSTNPTISNPAVALTASTVVTRGDGFGQTTDPFLFDLGTQVAFSVASMTTVITGSPSGVTLQLQGSIDGNNWTTLATSTSTSGDTQWCAGGVNQFTLLRVNCSALTGGTSPKVALALSAYASGQGAAGTQTVSGTVTANAGTGPFPASPFIPAVANVLCGSATATNTISAQTIITVPQGRTWYGTASISLLDTTAAASVTATINTAGTGVTPAAAVNILQAQFDATTAVGQTVINQDTSGPFYIVAPAGNSVTLTLTNSTATTLTSVATALGILL